MESVATSRVVGNNVKFIGRLDQVGSLSLFFERSPVMWMSFKTGDNANGYNLDRAEVKFSGDTDFEYMIPDDKYEVFIEDADSDFSPKEDVNPIMLAGDESISRGDVEAFQAPPIIHLGPNKKLNLATREKVEDGGWSCEATQNETLDSGAQPGWELPISIYHDSDPDATEESGATGRNTSSSCKFGVFGRAITTDAPRLASLRITNTPDDGDGFDSGEIVEVTAKFNKPITATLTMPINIGNKVAFATSTGTNTKTFVFEYEVLGTYIDGTGITFEENVLHGWVDADLGHNDLQPDTKNKVVRIFIQGPSGDVNTGDGIILAYPFDLEQFLGEEPKKYTYQWLRDGAA